MRKTLVWVLALVSAGCEVYAVPAPLVCQGTSVASFGFVGTQLATTTCAFAGPSNPNGQAGTSFSFTGSVAYDADGGSGACLSQNQPQARLNLGTHVGDSIAVGSLDTGGAINGCSCPTSTVIAIAQDIQGEILRDDAGTPSSFDGGMITTVSAQYADGGAAGSICCATPEADGGCACALPCTVVYDMVGSAVVTP